VFDNDLWYLDVTKIDFRDEMCEDFGRNLLLQRDVSSSVTLKVGNILSK
jgi:hypothetical protein